MKLLLSILAGLIMVTNATAQTMTAAAIEQELVRSYKCILQHRFGAGEVNMDTLAADNKAFRQLLLQYSLANPAMLTHRFESLKKEPVYIATSHDSLVKIYSWNTWMGGGTMRRFEHVFQYSVDGKLYAQCSYDQAQPDTNTPYYSKVYVLKTGDTTCYLAIGNNIFSGSSAGQSITVFALQGGRLRPWPLIVAKDGPVHTLSVTYELAQFANTAERPARVIGYDSEKRIIHVPAFDSNGRMTGRSARYNFEGGQFVAR